MGTKKIKFNVPSWVIVLIGAIIKVLNTVSLAGAGTIAIEAKVQMTPQSLFWIMATKLFLGYIKTAWIEQSISDDDDK